MASKGCVCVRVCVCVCVVGDVVGEEVNLSHCGLGMDVKCEGRDRVGGCSWS